VNGDVADPFRCPNAESGDGRDHVLVPEPPPESARFSYADSPQPFIRHRELLWTYRLARARGLSDADWNELVAALDEKVARVDGHGFLATPFAPSPALARALGLAPEAVWVKDETGNVSGSHKARHLFGIALALEIRERTGLADPAGRAGRELAIASCGNAALAAAVIARASGRPLRAYVPCDANPRVVARLADLGAMVEVCRRQPEEVGDPCLAAFCAARTRGAVPFCVQGNENGLTIEGGETLAWEMAETFSAAGVAPDRLFVQTGGGALASACVAGLRVAVERGLIPRLPRLHVVQTAAALPLRRAWERVAARALLGSEERAPELRSGQVAPGDGHGDATSAPADREWAGALHVTSRAGVVREAMRHAREHRGRFMWPVACAPHSLAHGILDDETYDWAAVVEGTIESGGWPLTVSEQRLAEARATAHRTTRIATDATGAAGLAGLMELSQAGAIGPQERVAVLFTGVER
jgi:threonine dehydratase